MGTYLIQLSNSKQIVKVYGANNSEHAVILAQHGHCQKTDDTFSNKMIKTSQNNKIEMLSGFVNYE